jgi:hypothetical protein
MFEAFHRFKPRVVGSFSPDFHVPAKMAKQGRAINVMYRSDKVDPATLKKPRRPVDYIHEHERGVHTYLTNTPGEMVEVPAWIREVDSLVLLGGCIGFTFDDPRGSEIEAHVNGKMPELYCTPDGRCLMVVQDKTSLIACMWGGSLGVEPRGIVG